jgi:hypothetical protein
MSEKKPEPLIPPRTRERCPVCGEISYSLAGVHPQCAVRQADEKRMNRTSGRSRPGVTATPENAAKPWQRVCPKCKALQHVRKKLCECGHSLAVGGRPPTTDSE